jgi:hypothetical protein
MTDGKVTGFTSSGKGDENWRPAVSRRSLASHIPGRQSPLGPGHLQSKSSNSAAKSRLR